MSVLINRQPIPTSRWPLVFRIVVFQCRYGQVDRCILICILLVVINLGSSFSYANKLNDKSAATTYQIPGEPSSNQTTTTTVNNSNDNDPGDDNETSDSMLNLSHQTNSKSSTKRSPDHNEKTNIDRKLKDMLQSNSSSNSRNNQPNRPNKSNRLKLFMINPVQSKISFTSLLPKSRRPQSEQTNPNRTSTTSAPQAAPQIPPLNLTEEPDDVTLESLLQDSINNPPPIMPPPPPQAPTMILPHHHHHHHHQLTPVFPFGPRLPTHLLAPHQQSALMNLNSHHQRPAGGDPFEQSAAQTIENYQKIRMNNQNTDLPSLLFGQTTASANHLGQSLTNDLRQFANQTQPPVMQHNTGVQLQQQSSNAAAALSHAAAAALLTERAKNLINHINKSGAFPMAASNSNININSVRHNHDTSSILNNRNQNQNQHPNINRNNNPNNGMVHAASNNMGLASMIKSAAEAWASSNVNVGGSIPQIVVEHDGPTMTTVDFGNQLRQFSPVPVENEPPDEDDDVSTFYSEEQSDSESEGSHEAKRIAKLRQQQRHPFPSRQHFGQQADPSTLDFYGNPPPPPPPLRQRPRFPPQMPPQHQAGRGEMNGDMMQDYVNSLGNNGPNGPSNYPDSINAIKERDNNNHQTNEMKPHREKNLASSLKEKLTGSNNQDQLEQLIEELQSFNKKKRRSKERDKSGNSKLNALLDDYEDLLGSKGEDDEEDDRTKLLRKKLMARLRAKTGNRERSVESNFHNEAIKIPLHALLLAALDRRMSPSESSGGTVIQELIGDERNKDTIAIAQQDFGDVTADLGLLMNSSQLYEQLTSTIAPPPVTNLLSLNYVDHRRVNETDSPSGDSDQQQQQQGSPELSRNNDEQGGDSVENHSNLIDDRDSQQSSGDEIKSDTTRVPMTTSQRQGGGGGGRRNQRLNQPTSRRQKGRRDVSDDDGDFDVDRQVEKYNSDKHEPNLEPDWAQRQRGNGARRQQGRDGRKDSNSVDFDDDYDEMAQATRRKMLKRRRQSKLDEPAYERKEQNFIDNIQKETATKIDIDRDIANIEEPVESGSEQRPTRNRRRQRRPARDGADESEDSDSGFDEPDEDGSERRSTMRPAERGEPPEDSDEGPSGEPRGSSGSSSTTSTTTWKPNMIDEEVRKIEMLARRERKGQRKLRRGEENNHDDQSDSNEGEGSDQERDQGQGDEDESPDRRMDTNGGNNSSNEKYEQTSESRQQQVGQHLGVVEKPDGPIIKLTIDSDENGNTNITQQYADDPAH